MNRRREAKQGTRGKKLVVRKETLRTLTASDLEQVAGGYKNAGCCTFVYSGCNTAWNGNQEGQDA